MVEVLIFVSGLSILTLVVAILYKKRISEAHQKYVEAKNAVDDIILSFNRQLERQGEHLGASSCKIDVLSTRIERVAELLKQHSKEIRALGEKVEALSALGGAMGRIDALESKTDEVVSVKDTLLKRVAEMEARRRVGRQKESEIGIESAIPIKREKALAPLTGTELTVLEFLATEGGKTAPEIKERIKLSREHTARLMKKLYEKGYLERGASKIPFTYRLKEEMLRLLRKPEQKG